MQILLGYNEPLLLIMPEATMAFILFGCGTAGTESGSASESPGLLKGLFSHVQSGFAC